MAHYHGSTHYHLLCNMNSKFPYYSTSIVNPAAAFEDEARLMAVSWPPRSYICSFCRRDFRSAQALGGHMNVHRRDRAKLNQKSHNNNDITQKPQPTFGNGDNSVETRLSVGINYDFGPGSTVLCKRSQKKESVFMEEDGDDEIDLELRLGDSPILMK